MMGNGCFGKRVDNRGASATKSVFDASSKNISNLFLDRDMGDAPEQLYYQLHLIIHILPLVD